MITAEKHFGRRLLRYLEYKYSCSAMLSTKNPQEKATTIQNNTATTEDVVIYRIDTKRVIVLNRPKALNALNLSMIHKIYPKLKSYSENPHDVKLVIMKGEGDKAFCAGGDVRAISEAKTNGTKVQEEFFRDEYKLNYLIGTLKVPFVALINGITMGGGVGLSVHGMFRVATERTVFAMPETAIGLFPDVGGSHFLPRLKGCLGTYLALTGHRLKGRDVVEAGVATHFVDSSLMNELEKQLLALKSEQLNKDSISILLSEYQSKSTKKHHEFSLHQHLNKINKIFAADIVEEILKGLENDGTDWAKSQIQLLSKMSPTSLKVTLRQIRTGANLDLKKCLEMEYRLSQRFVADHDFHEGVRAVLISKTNDPVWTPDKLENVTVEKVDSYFSPLPEEKELVLLDDSSKL